MTADEEKKFDGNSTNGCANPQEEQQQTQELIKSLYEISKSEFMTPTVGDPYSAPRDPHLRLRRTLTPSLNVGIPKYAEAQFMLSKAETSGKRLTLEFGVEFNGTKKDWPAWSTKFLAKARRKGYKKIILGDETIPKDSETLDPSTDQDKIDIREGNEAAYEELLLAMDTSTKKGKVAFQIVKKCKTSDLKDGDSSLAWKSLVQKYQPKTVSTLVNLKKSDTFKTVIPSKIFEAAALQKPILLGLEGETKGIIESFNAGTCFEPENEQEFISKCKAILNEPAYQEYQKGCQNLAVAFDRKKIASQVINTITTD